MPQVNASLWVLGQAPLRATSLEGFHPERLTLVPVNGSEWAVQKAHSALSQPYIDMFDGDWQDLDEETALVRRHLTGLTGTVLDVRCGPGHWAAYLGSYGAEVIGVDLVPEFIDHARARYPGVDFRLSSMTELDLPDHTVAGILAWYSTIHAPPDEMDQALAGLRRLPIPSAASVLGFFGSDDEAAAFDHKVTTAYRWAVDVFIRRLQAAGFAELERIQRRFPGRADRCYTAVAVRAV